MFNIQQSITTITQMELSNSLPINNNYTSIVEDIHLEVQPPNQVAVTSTPLNSRSIFRKCFNKPSFDTLVAICKNPDQNLAIKQLTDMLAECNYKSTKKWFFTKVLASTRDDGICRYTPIIYAYRSKNLIIATKLLQIMENKHLIEYKKHTNKLDWIIHLCSAMKAEDKGANTGEHDFLISTIIEIYIRNNTDLKNLEPVFKKHFGYLVSAIKKSIEYNCVNRLKTLLTIASTNASFVKEINNIFIYRRTRNIDILRNVFADGCTEKLEIIKIYKSLNFSLASYRKEFLHINNYDIFKFVLNEINNNYNYYIGEQSIANYAMEQKSYDVVLGLISSGASIHSTYLSDQGDAECNDGYKDCLSLIFWAIYNKDINMIEILLALGATRFHKHSIEEECKFYDISTIYRWFTNMENTQLKEINDILSNPPSLGRIATVNVAKNLIAKGKDNLHYTLNDIKQEVAEVFPVIAKDINSIEDLFSLNVLFKKSIVEQLEQQTFVDQIERV